MTEHAFWEAQALYDAAEPDDDEPAPDDPLHERLVTGFRWRGKIKVKLHYRGRLVPHVVVDPEQD